MKKKHDLDSAAHIVTPPKPTLGLRPIAVVFGASLAAHYRRLRAERRRRAHKQQSERRARQTERPPDRPLPLCGAEKHPSPQSCASDTYPPCSSSASVLQHDHHTQFVRSSFIQQRRGTNTMRLRTEWCQQTPVIMARAWVKIP